MTTLELLQTLYDLNKLLDEEKNERTKEDFKNQIKYYEAELNMRFNDIKTIKIPSLEQKPIEQKPIIAKLTFKQLQGIKFN